MWNSRWSGQISNKHGFKSNEFCPWKIKLIDKRIAQVSNLYRYGTSKIKNKNIQ